MPCAELPATTASYLNCKLNGRQLKSTNNTSISEDHDYSGGKYLLPTGRNHGEKTKIKGKKAGRIKRGIYTGRSF
jgi:hypothetical protein